MDVDHIIPEPEAASAGVDRTTYSFRVTDPTRPGRIVFGFVPGPALDLVRPPASVTLEQVGVQDVPATAATEEGSD
jgi:NADH-quinone oxidoreductase subunit M